MLRILRGLLIIGTISVLVTTATQALFSDTETSTGNVFHSGQVDLKIDSTAIYNNISVPASSWSEKDLSSEKFFNFSNLLPGDWGRNTISMHVVSEDALGCISFTNYHDNDDLLNTPESLAGDSTIGIDQGELSQELHFYSWWDNGNGIWENGESTFFSNVSNSAKTVLDNVTYSLGPLPTNSTKYLSIYWCYGTLTADQNTHALGCGVAAATNLTQTDSAMVDVGFRVQQARNNNNFSCQYSLGVNKTGDGTVTSSPAGINCGSTCSAIYNPATSVTLTAAPGAGSSFAGWSGGACSGTGTCTMNMNSNQNVLATFTVNTYVLTVSKNGTGTGTVTSSPLGISCGANCAASYNYNQQVVLTAIASGDSNFAGWSGCDSPSGNTCTVNMITAKSITATFNNNQQYTLSIAKSGEGNGSVTSSPAGIDCGSTCAASFASNTFVTLTTTPDSLSFFSHWTGACAGSGACSVTMNAARSVTAVFLKKTFVLTVAKSGSGTGLVSSNPTGIDCGATCSSIYSAGTTVGLSATPNADSIFTGWSGACSGTGSCFLTMDAAKTVTATFTIKTYTASVSRTEGGSVTSNPSGIACGSTCSATYNAGTTLTLTASPGTNATFAGWSGACTGSTSTCVMTMDASKSVNARFTYPLIVSVTGRGTVTGSPAGISCGTTCSYGYDGGSTVTLTATPQSGATFTGWSGACTGTGSCSVFMSDIRNLGATFIN